ncbi:MAG: aminotransferase class IV [Desulfobacterales bacterium]|jgi:branched-chain amino acid aminotransferase|nr:aminotransferase class IV [Desulfobacterales bacterium]
MASIFYVDGQFVEAQNATIPVDDLALLRGYGVFDFLRTYNGKPFYLEAHVNRLFQSAAGIGLHLPWSKPQVIDIVTETLAKNHYSESNIRILVTGGSSDDGITPMGNSRLLVMITGLKPKPAWWYEKGVSLATYRTERDFPCAKSINYIAAIHALRKAEKAGAVEALYIGEDQHVLECTTSNFFGFKGDTLVTPDSNILPGITRQVVLELASKVFRVEQRPVSLEELPRLDEVFITSSTREVLPIVRIDDMTFSQGKPGSRTLHVMRLFSDFVKEYARSR